MLRGRLLCKDYKVLGTQYLIDKNSKVSTPAAVRAKNFRVFTFSPIGPRSSTVFWTNTTYCAFVTNVQSVLPKDFFLLFLVMFMCNLAWQPVNKTFIKHYHIDAVLSWPKRLFLNIYIASFVPIVHSQSRFQICIRVVLKSTWSCPRTVKKVSRSWWNFSSSAFLPMYLSTCDRGEVNEGDHDLDDFG